MSLSESRYLRGRTGRGRRLHEVSLRRGVRGSVLSDRKDSHVQEGEQPRGCGRPCAAHPDGDGVGDAALPLLQEEEGRVSDIVTVRRGE